MGINPKTYKSHFSEEDIANMKKVERVLPNLLSSVSGVNILPLGVIDQIDREFTMALHQFL